MDSLSTRPKVIWAIDPFDTKTKPDLLSLKELKAWKSVGRVEIQPVYVLTLDTSEEVPDKTELSKHLASARKAAIQYLDSMEATWAEPPVILVDRSGYIDSAVGRLLAFAKFEGAELIAVSTRGQSGIPRMIFGSFAESLLRRSTTPVLFLSHEKRKQPLDLKRALFATDFSTYSRVAFRKFISRARGRQTHVTLFHHVSIPRQVATMSASGASMAYFPERYLEDQLAWARREGKKWAKWASAENIELTVQITDKGGDTADLIVNTAREKGAGLIALASQSGPVASFLLGSVARGVFRPHDIPVWVSGPALLERLSGHPDSDARSVVASEQEVS